MFVKYQRTVYNKVYPVVAKHIWQLTEIKVPYEAVEKVNDNTPQKDPSEQFKKEDLAAETNETENVNVDDFNNDTNETDHVTADDSNNETNDTENVHSDSSSDPGANEYSELKGDVETTENEIGLEDVYDEVKSDLAAAIDKGEQEMARLSTKSASMIEGMESFDADAMDELFDDSDDNNTETDGEIKSITSSPSLPYSSLTSKESITSMDQSAEFAHIAELEVEAVQRHLKVRFEL